MKKLFYLALIGSLALAGTARAEDDKHPQKKAHGGGHAAPAAAQRAPGRGGSGAAHAQVQRGGNPGHAQVQHVGNPGHAHQRPMNPGRNNNATIVHQNNARGSSAAALHRNDVNVAPAHRNAAKVQRQNTRLQQAKAAQSSAPQTAAARPQQNAAGNRFANLKPNRHRQVPLVNNWSGSRYSGERYSAFRNYRRQEHDRSYYQSHYNRLAVFGGGRYYWDNGYWYPAWGYDSGYRYDYDGPIYGYNNLDPQQVVVNVQTQLQEAGYYDGPIDGSIGPITRGALAAFQADQGLPVTSAIDEPTLATLGLV